MMTTLFTLLTLFSYVGMEVHVFVKLFFHMNFFFTCSRDQFATSYGIRLKIIAFLQGCSVETLLPYSITSLRISSQKRKATREAMVMNDTDNEVAKL